MLPLGNTDLLHTANRKVAAHKRLYPFCGFVPLEINQETPSHALDIAAALRAAEEALALQCALGHKFHPARVRNLLQCINSIPIRSHLTLNHICHVRHEGKLAAREVPRNASPDEALNPQCASVQERKPLSTKFADDAPLNADRGVVPAQDMANQNPSDMPLNGCSRRVESGTHNMVRTPSGLYGCCTDP
jgi:hypothetical protein